MERKTISWWVLKLGCIFHHDIFLLNAIPWLQILPVAKYLKKRKQTITQGNFPPERLALIPTSGASLLN